MSDLIKKYDTYCDLVSKMSEKISEMERLKNKVNLMNYEISTLEKQINKIKNKDLNSTTNFNKALRLKMNNCLNGILMYDTGGSVAESPMADFLRSDSYKRLSNEEKSNFQLIKPQLTSKQYNIQNALLISEDNGGFELYSDPTIKDFVSETVNNLDNYDDLSADKIRKIKEIMYIFVEHVSI